MNKRRIIILALSCFLLGGAVGVIGMQQFTRKRIRSIIEMQRPPKFKKQLEEALELSPEQSEKYNDIFHAHIERARMIHRTERDSLRVEMDRLFNTLAKELNPGQVEKLRNFEEEMRRNHHKRMRKRKGKERG